MSSTKQTFATTSIQSTPANSAAVSKQKNAAVPSLEGRLKMREAGQPLEFKCAEAPPARQAAESRSAVSLLLESSEYVQNDFARYAKFEAFVSAARHIFINF